MLTCRPSVAKYRFLVVWQRLDRVLHAAATSPAALVFGAASSQEIGTSVLPSSVRLVAAGCITQSPSLPTPSISRKPAVRQHTGSARHIREPCEACRGSAHFSLRELGSSSKFQVCHHRCHRYWVNSDLIQEFMVEVDCDFLLFPEKNRQLSSAGTFAKRNFSGGGY